MYNGTTVISGKYGGLHALVKSMGATKHFLSNELNQLLY